MAFSEESFSTSHQRQQKQTPAFPAIEDALHIAWMNEVKQSLMLKE